MALLDSLNDLRARLTDEGAVVSISHQSIPQEQLLPFAPGGSFDMNLAIDAMHDGAVAGLAFEQITPSETGHVFGFAGRVLYVDYGMADRTETLTELKLRLERGMKVIEAHAEGRIITLPQMESIE